MPVSPQPASVPARPRLRLILLLLAPFGGLLLVEAGLRVAQGLGKLEGWLYMPGVRTEFSSVMTLEELLASHWKAFPPLSPTKDITLTSKGLRTLHYEEDKAPGTLRIVALGDSHTFRSGGMPFPSLWHRQLAAVLSNSSETETEVISLGIPAVGPDFELRLWELEGSRLSADVVILAVSVGNDFLDVLGELSDETRLDRWSRGCLTVRLWRNLSRLRAAEATGDPGLRQSATAPVPAPDAGLGGVYHPQVRLGYDRRKPKFSPRSHRKIMARRLANARITRSRIFESAADRFTKILDALHADVRRHNAELVLLLIPDEYQLDEELYASLVEDSGQPPQRFEIDRPQRVLGQYCASRGILCVDPLPELRAAAAANPMFNLREGHLNDRGHALLGSLLGDALIQAGMAP